MGKIVVAGSLNMDLAVRVEHIPAGGETILGSDLLESPGGKGANQAYAGAKLSRAGNVIMLGCVGEDAFGIRMLGNLEEAGCDVSHAMKVPGPSGVALIAVSRAGENAIVVAPGANAHFTPELAERVAPLLADADALLLQLEIPLDTVMALAQAAHKRSVPVILDPAPVPMNGLPEELLRLVSILTPNETEAAALTGITDTKTKPDVLLGMAQQLTRQSAAAVLKLGGRGCLLYQGGEATFLPAPKVEAVDTTAAGDIFNGALAVGLGDGLKLAEACWFATQAAALSVTRAGAQLSAPSRVEVDGFMPALPGRPVL